MQQTEKAYCQIRTMLTSGELAPGDRLITRNLAAKIGVSLGPIREAIQRLSIEGLIRHTPGAGAAVPQPTRTELEELYVLRDATESCAAALVAKHASSALLARLESLVDSWEEISQGIASSAKQHANKRQLDTWLDIEEQFHELMIEGARNQLLAKVIREHHLISKVFEAQRNNPKILDATVATETASSRRELVEALRRGDAEVARKLMSEQIQRGQQHVLNHYPSSGIN